MSRRAAERWLRCYPRAWRERYGEELLELMAAMSADGRIGWRARLNILHHGARERLRAWGLGRGIPQRDRTRAGLLLVLCAWALFLIGGVLLQRFSENWSSVTPPVDRALPAAAYGTLIGAALLAAVLVAAGIALAIPRTLAFLRCGGLRELRASITHTGVATMLALAAFVVILVWSRHLDALQRNGHDAGYEIAFAACALAAAGALFSWTALAVRIARLIDLPESSLRLQRLLALGVWGCMAVMLIATGVWWGLLAHSAPWALLAEPPGAGGPVVSAQLLTAGALMALATTVGATGIATALRAGGQPPASTASR